MIEDIRNTIENELGIKTFEDYSLYKSTKRELDLPQEDIDKLSPDTIRSDQFWEWTAQSEFEKDAVTNGVTKEQSIHACNYSNYNIALITGCLNYFHIFSQLSNQVVKKFNVLEIGPGYGFFKTMCEEFPNIDYVGVDVYPRIPGILKIADGDTQLPDEVIAKKFDLVFSSNVFQHLTPRQRRSYYSQVADVLAPYGIFSFNTITKSDKGFKSGDRRYMCHYGQYTELQNLSEYIEELSEYFTILSTAQRIDNIDTFHCTNKKSQYISMVK